MALITPITATRLLSNQFILQSSGICNVQAKDIKTGTVVVHNGNPVIIQGISVHSPSARGAATLYKFRARNVVTGNKVDLTLKGTESLGEADFSRRNVQLMYSDATSMFLMGGKFRDDMASFASCPYGFSSASLRPECV